MTEELAVIEQTSAVANSPAQLSELQAPLAGWARVKLNEARAEHQELTQAADEAKKHKWKASTIVKAAAAALSRVTFYDKVVKALEAGYMLFPPVPNADVIAIRTGLERAKSKTVEQSSSWGSPGIQEIPTDSLPSGEGEYKNPFCGWFLMDLYNDEKGNEKKSWELLTCLKQAEFPLVMAKPSIVAATNAAMEMKVFDEIRLFPFTQKRGDPCILGTVVDKHSERRHHFLISWRIDARDI